MCGKECVCGSEDNLGELVPSHMGVCVTFPSKAHVHTHTHQAQMPQVHWENPQLLKGSKLGETKEQSEAKFPSPHIVTRG